MSKSRRDPQLEAFWRQTLQQWKQSGLTIRDFCRRHGLSEPRFHFWKHQLPRRDRDDPRREEAPAPVFVPLRVVHDAPLEIVLPSGILLRVPPTADPDAVARLVAALGRPSC